MSKTAIVITCEHASNKIPAKYKDVFSAYHKLLESHRGWDIGIVYLYRFLQQAMDGTFICAKWSRLLIELNRSQDSLSLFSPVTNLLTPEQKNHIMAQYYHPYRNNVLQSIQHHIKSKKNIIHISLHSFTPVLNNEVRNADIGLLYDPQRLPERRFCYALKQHLKMEHDSLRIRMNYPYKGTADGLTTSLRKLFPAHKYIGVELEINQKFLQQSKQAIPFCKSMAQSLSAFLDGI